MLFHVYTFFRGLEPASIRADTESEAVEVFAKRHNITIGAIYAVPGDLANRYSPATAWRAR